MKFRLPLKVSNSILSQILLYYKQVFFYFWATRFQINVKSVETKVRVQ